MVIHGSLPPEMNKYIFTGSVCEYMFVYVNLIVLIRESFMVYRNEMIT